MTRDLKNGVSKMGIRRPQKFVENTLEDVKSNFRPTQVFGRLELIVALMILG